MLIQHQLSRAAAQKQQPFFFLLRMPEKRAILTPAILCSKVGRMEKITDITRLNIVMVFESAVVGTAGFFFVLRCLN